MPKYYLLGAALLAGSVLVPASAMAQDREMIKAQISYSDLNLASAAGQAAFKRRVQMTASQVCGEPSKELRLAVGRARCIKEMQRDGDVRLASIAPSASQRLAAVEPRKSAH